MIETGLYKKYDFFFLLAEITKDILLSAYIKFNNNFLFVGDYLIIDLLKKDFLLIQKMELYIMGNGKIIKLMEKDISIIKFVVILSENLNIIY